MTDPPPGMVAHSGLKLRLVFHSVLQPVLRPEAGAAPRKGGENPAPVPGRSWRLSGLLPEQATPGEAGATSPPITLTLDRDEAEGYYLNLTSPQPSLFVLLRQQDVAVATALHDHEDIPEVEAVTASYSEAARWMDGGMAVVRTALPGPMLAWIAEFAQYHFPLEGKKKRGAFRPSFLSRQEFGDVTRVERQQAAGLPRQVPEGRVGDGR